jgi:hypothetical protein
MAGNTFSVSSAFDKFADRTVQTSTLETDETSYKPIASVDQCDLEFLIPANHDTYIDLNMQLYVRGKLTNAEGAVLEATDYTAGVNNFLHSIFSQFNISLKGVNITPSSDNYHYRAYFVTLLGYGSDAADTHLTNRYWYLDNGNMQACDLTDISTDETNQGFIARLSRMKQSKEIEMLG